MGAAGDFVHGPRGKKLVVLVVEDDPAVRRLMKRMITRMGVAVLTASTAQHGLARVRRERGAIDLAILDMVMPGMSGLDLATELDRQYPNLRILYISGYVDSVAMEVIARQHPERVLLKPFGEQALLDRVRLLMGIPYRQPSDQGSDASVVS